MLAKFGILIIAVWLQIQFARSKRGRYEPNIPEECLRQGFCEDVPDYPQELADKLIESMDPSVFEEVYTFGRDQTSDPLMRNGDEPKSEPKEVQLCAATQKEVFLKAAPTTNGNWVHLLTRRWFGPELRFKVELCKFIDVQCATNMITYKPNYSASCKQNHVNVTVMAINKDGQPEETVVKIPSYCYCRVYRDY